LRRSRRTCSTVKVLETAAIINATAADIKGATTLEGIELLPSRVTKLSSLLSFFCRYENARGLDRL
jgi:hypothetical protein